MTQKKDEQDFTNVQMIDPSKPEMALTAPVEAHDGNLAVEQSRAVAEVQASLVIAKKFPRNEIQAFNNIINACARFKLAKKAEYSYPRGGTQITGPSIRLAEVLARCWGNIDYGIIETDRRVGESDMMAFAWDKETNTRVIRQFTVRHVRDKQSGNVDLKSERDIYEMTANQGQRRVRACILEIIPGDVVDEAIEQCHRTIEKGYGKTLDDLKRELIVAFGKFGIDQAMIEKRILHKYEALTYAEYEQLNGIYNGIRDGHADRTEFFDISGKAEVEKNKETPQTQKPEETEEPKKRSYGEYKAELEIFTGDNAAIKAQWAEIEETAQADLTHRSFTMLHNFARKICVGLDSHVEPEQEIETKSPPPEKEKSTKRKNREELCVQYTTAITTLTSIHGVNFWLEENLNTVQETLEGETDLLEQFNECVFNHKAEIKEINQQEMSDNKL